MRSGKLIERPRQVTAGCLDFANQNGGIRPSGGDTCRELLVCATQWTPLTGLEVQSVPAACNT